MSEALYIKTLEDAALYLKDIPLFGAHPPFPFEKFSNAIKTLFDLENVTISVKNTDFKKGSDLALGMGKNKTIFHFSLSPLSDSFSFILPKESVDTLIRELLSSELLEPAVQEGYLQFAMLNIVEMFNREQPFAGLGLSIAEETPLPEEGALSLDVGIEINQSNIQARILIPKELHLSFQAYFEREKPSLLENKEMASLPLTCILEAGSTVLSMQKWSDIQVGDCLLLDRCTFDIQNKKGTAVLTLAEHPLFDVRIKDGSVKILEYALTTKAESMTDENEEMGEESEEILPQPEEEQASLPEEETEEPLWSAETKDEPSDLLSSKDIPISLTVEVGRFQMPLEKLSELKPGNVLDLSLSPELSCHLTTNGKRVAKGELVKIGEAIGVKILKLGN